MVRCGRPPEPSGQADRVRALTRRPARQVATASEADRLLQKNERDAARRVQRHTTHDQNVIDGARDAIGFARARALKGISMIVDAAEAGLDVRHDLLAAHD
jgi:hypothetical protein